VDLNKPELPGIVFTIDTSLPIDDDGLKQAVKAMGFGVKARVVPLSAWEKDVEFHAGRKSTPFTSARVPIHLSLKMEDGDGKKMTGSRFCVQAVRFNPTLHCGCKLGRQTLEATVGLREGSMHGLEIQAHNRSGLLAACQWVRSTEGKALVADSVFEVHRSKATEAEHCAVDQKTGESGPAWLVEGGLVLCEGVKMECVKKTGERVRLKRKDGKMLWRKMTECTRCIEKQ